MNIKNLNFFKNKYSIENLDKNEKLNINAGETLNGKVINESEDKILIEFENFELNLPKTNVKANLNDTVSFEILENKNNKLNLKQIYPENYIEEDINKSPYIETILDDSFAYKNFLNKNKDTKNKENILAKKELKESLKHISNSANKENIEDMLKKSLNPEKNTPFTMSDFISKSVGLDFENKNNKKDIQKEKNIKLDLNMNGINEEDMLSFENALLKTNLPTTQKNIEILKNAKNKFEEIKELDDNSIKNLLKKDNITFEDLYTNKHLKNIAHKKIDLEAISNLEEQIKNILLNEEIPLKEENISIAKDFVENEIEISKENFDKLNKLKNLQKNFDSFNILEKVAQNIKANKPISNIEIFENKDKINLFSSYKNILEKIPNIKIEDIQNLLNNKIPVNLKNLTESLNSENLNKNLEISKDAILERLNLAKIQMKLTYESISILAQKGININPKPLLNVISTLESLEMENYKNSLKIVNANVNNENIAKVQKFYSTLSEITPKLFYSTFKEIKNGEIDFSFKGISESIRAKNIIKTFDTFKTVPDSKYGDNVYKLTDEFKKLLKDNGFEINEKNLKAAKILTLNNMDFNTENLINVKLIDSKIEYVFNKLHPVIASDMIKNDFNPLEKNIDDLIEYIDNFSEEFGQTSKEKIAQHILELDNSNALSKEERSAIISIYRMLNLIEKDNTSSIGTLLKNEKNVTLGNLLESAKEFKKFKRKINFDEKIDDKTEIKEKINLDKNIINSIEKGLEYNNNLEYNRLILNEIINNATPEKLIEYTKAENDISIENMNENLKNSNKISEISQNDILEKARNIEEISQNTIEYLFKNNIPTTINNIYNMEDSFKENNKISNSIEDFKNELSKRNISFGESILKADEEIENLNGAINSINNLEKENIEIFDDIIELDELDDIKYMILKNKDVSSKIKFLKDINKAENGIYSLPLRLSNGKITDFNVFILNEKALEDKNLNLFLQFNNKHNENMQTYIKITENGTFANITTKNANSKDIPFLEKEIIKILEKLNIKPEYIKYSTEDEINIFDSFNKEKIANKLKNLESEFETIA